MLDYELGLLCACTGDIKSTKEHLDLVLSGKPLVQKPEKGKYSMEVRFSLFRYLPSYLRHLESIFC